MKKLCIFDLDGTLVNSIEDIAFAVNRGLKLMGLPDHPVSAFNLFVGDGMYKLCERALPEDCQERVNELLKLYNDYYINHCCVLTKPYDGIPELLKALKLCGVRLAVLSNKPHPQTVNVINNLFGSGVFDYVLGQKPEFPVKPNPEALIHLIESAGVSLEDAVNIGDSNVDIILGRNAGIDSIGVSWGFRGRNELLAAGAERIADTPSQIYAVLKQM